MSRGRNHFFLIVLLALLQCFAPLLHAHTHDSLATAGVHLHDMHELHAHDVSASGVPTFQADHGDAPVIAMAREFRQDDAMELAGTDQPPVPPYLSTSGFTEPFLAAPAPVPLLGCPRPYSRPFSQAPPSALI